MSQSSQAFFPIRVSTLRGDQKIGFDVFVRVAGKHILYCRKGDSFDGVRLDRLKEKKLKVLFVSAEGQPEFRKYLAQNVEIAYFNTAGKPMDERCHIIAGLQEAVTEDVLDDPTSSASYEVLKADTKRYVEFLLTENDALKGIISHDPGHTGVAQHSVGVAALAVSLAHFLGVTDTELLQMLAIGCLLHDVEHFHNGLDVAHPVKGFGEADLKTYRNHPEKGLDRIKGTQFYENLVQKIIRSHHEFINGTGFPHGLKESDLDPMVMIVSVADSYDRLISYEDISPKEAVKKLLIDKVGLHPLPMIQGLAAVLKAKGVIAG